MLTVLTDMPPSHLSRERESCPSQPVTLNITDIYRTRKDITLPFSTPIPVTPSSTSTETHVTSIHLKANTNVIIGIGAANLDPLIWGDNAHEWKPERWLGQGLDIASEKLPGVYSGMWVVMVFSQSIDCYIFSIYLGWLSWEVQEHACMSHGLLPIVSLLTHFPCHRGFKFSQLEMSMCI